MTFNGHIKMDRYPDRLEGVQAFFFNRKYSFVLKKKIFGRD